jgi:hypothetical protein
MDLSFETDSAPVTEAIALAPVTGDATSLRDAREDEGAQLLAAVKRYRAKNPDDFGFTKAMQEMALESLQTPVDAEMKQAVESFVLAQMPKNLAAVQANNTVLSLPTMKTTSASDDDEAGNDDDDDDDDPHPATKKRRIAPPLDADASQVRRDEIADEPAEGSSPLRVTKFHGDDEQPEEAEDDENDDKVSENEENAQRQAAATAAVAKAAAAAAAAVVAAAAAKFDFVDEEGRRHPKLHSVAVWLAASSSWKKGQPPVTAPTEADIAQLDADVTTRRFVAPLRAALTATSVAGKHGAPNHAVMLAAALTRANDENEWLAASDLIDQLNALLQEATNDDERRLAVVDAACRHLTGTEFVGLVDGKKRKREVLARRKQQERTQLGVLTVRVARQHGAGWQWLVQQLPDTKSQRQLRELVDVVATIDSCTALRDAVARNQIQLPPVARFKTYNRKGAFENVRLLIEALLGNGLRLMQFGTAAEVNKREQGVDNSGDQLASLPTQEGETLDELDDEEGEEEKQPVSA